MNTVKTGAREKLARLREILREMNGALLALSGGTDSSFLLRIASETIGAGLLAATASSEIHPAREIESAESYARSLGVTHIILRTGELEREVFAENTSERCYHCKRDLFKRLVEIARERSVGTVIDGSNSDDDADFRPGQRALAELGVRSPLREAGLTKSEIRSLAREMGVPAHASPSQACLASRFPYGTRITRERVAMVARAEEILAGHGFTQLRVRYYGETARIECLPGEMRRLLMKDISDDVVRRFKELGFLYVTLDLEGYRTGSLNEGLKKNLRSP